MFLRPRPHVHMYPDTFEYAFHSHASGEYNLRIRNISIRKVKFADSKVYRYVWTGPKRRVIRDFKIRSRQRRRKRQRTIALISENKICTLECSVLTACLPSSLVIRHEKFFFRVLWTTWTTNNKIWQSLFALEAEPFTFYCSRISYLVRREKFIDD